MGIVGSRFFVVPLIICMFFVSCKRAVYSGGAQDNLHLNVRVKYSADVEGAEARVAYVVRNAGDSTLVIPSDIAGYLDIEIESYGRSAVRLPEPGVKHPLGKTLSSVLVLLPGMVLRGEVQLAKVSFESMSKEYSRLAFTYHEQGMDFLKASNGVFYALPGKGRFEVSGVLLSLPMVSSPYFDPDDGTPVFAVPDKGKYDIRSMGAIFVEGSKRGQVTKVEAEWDGSNAGHTRH